MKNKKQQSEALEAERHVLELQLKEEQSKTFESDENKTDVLEIARIEQSIASWQKGIETIINRINEIDIELTMLCVGGLE